MIRSRDRSDPASRKSSSNCSSHAPRRNDAFWIRLPRRRRPISGQEEQAIDGRPEAAPPHRAEQPSEGGSGARPHPRLASIEQVPLPSPRAVASQPRGLRVYSAIDLLTRAAASSPTRTAQRTSWSPRSGGRSTRRTTRMRRSRAEDAAL